MTVKELYEWAKKNECENHTITFIDDPEQEMYVEPILDDTEIYEDELYLGADMYSHMGHMIVLRT